MRREVKFKAWDKINKKMLTWEEIWDQNLVRDIFVYDGDYIPLQFTGLKDSEGNEIHLDSDIVKYKFTRVVDNFKDCSYIDTHEDGSRTYKKIESLPCIITIRNPKTGSEFYNSEYDLYTPLWVQSQKDLDKIKIIGNIYEGLKIDL